MFDRLLSSRLVNNIAFKLLIALGLIGRDHDAEQLNVARIY